MTRTVDGGRVAARLAAKAARITDDIDAVRLAICARGRVVDPPRSALIVTAEEIFAFRETRAGASAQPRR